MKNKFHVLPLVIIIVFCLSFIASAQHIHEDITTTQNEIMVEGKKISYSVYAGYLPIKNFQDSTLAKVFFIYYQKKDEPTMAKRPIMFAYIYWG